MRRRHRAMTRMRENREGRGSGNPIARSRKPAGEPKIESALAAAPLERAARCERVGARIKLGGNVGAAFTSLSAFAWFIILARLLGRSLEGRKRTMVMLPTRNRFGGKRLAVASRAIGVVVVTVWLHWSGEASAQASAEVFCVDVKDTNGNQVGINRWSCSCTATPLQNCLVNPSDPSAKLHAPKGQPPGNYQCCWTPFTDPAKRGAVSLSRPTAHRLLARQTLSVRRLRSAASADAISFRQR